MICGGWCVVSLCYPRAGDPHSQEQTASRASLCCRFLLGEGSSPPDIWRGCPPSFLRFPPHAQRRVAALRTPAQPQGSLPRSPRVRIPALVSQGRLPPPTLRRLLPEVAAQRTHRIPRVKAKVSQSRASGFPAASKDFWDPGANRAACWEHSGQRDDCV